LQTLNNSLTILRTVFGYEQFRGNQQDVIDVLLARKDALVLMPTGGGKSLCYQIPAIMSAGVGVVISPLIALMEDQVNALLQNGIRAAYLNSTLGFETINEVEQQLKDDKLDLIYMAPERLMASRTIDLLSRIRIALFAIDEAHCVSQWGHDFRQDYLQLSILQEKFPQVPRMALTATADESTRNEIITRLGLQTAEIFISGFDRPNIHYRISPKQDTKKQLLNFLDKKHKDRAGIIYCLSRKKVDSLSEWLRVKGYDALPYHAGLDHETRRLHQRRFVMEEGVIVVATVAFGMGIDKPNVRFVVHMDLPKSLEAYYQEIGRAGRDGLAADAWMVYGMQDIVVLRQMLQSSDANEKRKRIESDKINALLGFCETSICRRSVLLEYFGETSAEPCGNCDNCVQPVDSWDATESAQMALSCVYRTGQRFGVNYLVDVLLGKDNARIKSFNHHQQSTFGIGKDLSSVQWRALFRQLVACGYLDIDIEGYGALRLTEACRPVLRAEQSLMLRKDPDRKLKKTQRKDKNFVEPMDVQLWDLLRAERRKIASTQGVPPYIIFHDSTLMELVEKKPITLAEMAELTGVGERKLEKYGHLFVGLIDEYLLNESSVRQ